jgi:hypothetical protein
LRQQPAVLRRKTRRPRLQPIERAFWIILSRCGSRWKDALAVVKPKTVIAWHRRGFARFWTWKSRRIGRPPIEPEVLELIVRMATENPRWSRRRIATEIARLGIRVDKNTVARYMPKRPKRPRRLPSQPWGTFVRNHLVGTLAVDFFTVPTVTFDILYVFVVLSLERRRLMASTAPRSIVQSKHVAANRSALEQLTALVAAAAECRRCSSMSPTGLRSRLSACMANHREQMRAPFLEVVDMHRLPWCLELRRSRASPPIAMSRFLERTPPSSIGSRPP